MRDKTEHLRVTVSGGHRAERIAAVCILSVLATLFFGLTDLAIPTEVVCLLIGLFGPACVVAFVGWVAVASLPAVNDMQGKSDTAVEIGGAGHALSSANERQ